MIDIGKIHALEVLKHVDFGLYLDGGEAGEILLPVRYVPEDIEIGSFIQVFIYLDNEERLIATTQTPLAQVGDFACLRVVDVNTIGAFLDWGLMKQLLVPYSEQKNKLKTGDTPIVYVYVDEKSNRIAASAKVEKFIDKEVMPVVEENEEVDLLIYKKTDLGYNAIINNKYIGLIYENEIFKPIHIGLRTKGYVKSIRPDYKIDLSLEKPGEKITIDSEKVIKMKLIDAGGFLPYTDKSDPDTIYSFFEMSKKSFKKAIGGLYKKQEIAIEKNGIRLIQENK